MLIGIPVSSPIRSYIEYTQTPFTIYQYVIKLVVSLSIRSSPGVFMNIRCGNIVLLTTRFFLCAKSNILTQLSLLSRCRLSFPIFSLKIFSLPSFALKCHKRVFIGYLGKLWKTCSNLSQNLSFESTLFSSLGACTFKTMLLHKQPLRTTYYILPLTNSTLLTADDILFPSYDFRFLFRRTIYYSAPSVNPPN